MATPRNPFVFLKYAIIGAVIFLAASSVANANAELASIRSIAVISAIGDSITFASVGALNLHSGAKSLSVSDWNLDSELEQEVASKLEKRFQIVPAVYNRSSFAREISHTITLEEPPIRNLVSKLSAPVDAYLVISKRGTTSTHEYLNLTGGIDVLEQTSVFRKSIYALCILAQVQLIDARTNEIIAHDEIVLKPGIRYDDPENQFDPSLWPANGSDLTNMQRNELRKLVTSKLITTIDSSLITIGLAP